MRNFARAPDQFNYDVFLSHNLLDKPWVRELAGGVRDAGLRVFFDEDSIPPGGQILREVESAVAGSRYILVVITAASLESQWVALEVALTLSVDVDAADNRLLPVLLEPVDLERIRPAVRTLNIFDFTNELSRDFDFARLMEHLGIERAKIPRPPPWPWSSIPSPAREQRAIGVSRSDLGQSPPRAFGNQLGVGSGSLVLDESEIADVFRQTGNKVILVTNDVHLGLPFDMIAGIVTSQSLGESSHLGLTLTSRRIPVVYVDPGTFRKLEPNNEVTIDSSARGEPGQLITFSYAHIHNRQKEYEQSLRSHLDSGADGVPDELISLVIEPSRRELPQEFLSWCRAWGPLQEITRALLPLIGAHDFAAAADLCKELCSEYQWPVGRQEARRVLPQLAHYRREETLHLLDSWVRSDSPDLAKSAAMTLGSIVLMDPSLGRKMTYTIVQHPNDTVVKEALRAVPIIHEVDRDLADYVIDRCRSIRSLAAEFSDYRERFYGLTMASIPGYLAYSRQVAYARINEAVRVVSSVGAGDSDANLARNYIFANLLLLAEDDQSKLAGLLDGLRPFAVARHVQADVIVAAARVARYNGELAERLVSLIESKVDRSFAGFLQQLKNAGIF